MTQPLQPQEQNPPNQNPSQAEKPANNANIQGEPLPLGELLDFATIDPEDVESAAQWFDDNASEDWIGALDNEPMKGDKK